jgi:two-component system response regulator AlgR
MNEAPSNTGSADMRTLIVDDEPPARMRLRALLGELRGVEVAGEAANGVEALALCTSLNANLVLLDVHMPGMNGIETARHLARFENPPAIIFATAYDEYALEAFETQALGYLLKPVRREKLARAVRHAARVANPQLIRLGQTARMGHRREQICVRLGEDLRLVPVEDIYYFAADQKYVTVRHRGGSDLIEEPLRALAEEFAPDFLRIHRNSVVSLRQVRSVVRDQQGKYCVSFKDCEETLPISRRHAGDALRQIKGHQQT